MAEHTRFTKARRPYRLRARAEDMHQTRRRIVQAAIGLHGSIGPAATTMSAVAGRAGVTRATLYRHFPTAEALFAACSTDWLGDNPRPDVALWAGIVEPADRLDAALDELYAYYSSTEQMRANLLRDIEVLPQDIRFAISGYPMAVADVLDAGWPALSDARLRRAVIGHVVAFETWRSLARQGLSNREATELMVRLVTSAAIPE